MIVLRNLTKVFSMRGQRKVVVDNVNMTFPTGVAVGLLGRNGAGKSTLLKIIAGTTTPSWGEVLSTGTVSFPVGLASSLHPDLTGAQNVRFVARIYGADTEALIDYVGRFAELGPHFHLPVRSYSSGMRGRLSFGMNMGLSFDTYLIDEVTAVGDAAFKRKSRDVFLARMEKAGAIFVSHSMGAIREMCTAGALLEDGHLNYYEDVEEAIDRYMQSLSGNRVYQPEVLPEGVADMDFPRDARMLFGLGAEQTGINWLGDCLRRHRPCHFGKEREPHYFDIRAGQAADTMERRVRSARILAERMGDEQGPARANTVRLLREVSDVLAIHAAPADGPDRHDAYLDYILTGRKTQPVVCDFTPGYATLSSGDFGEMATIGGARFILVLRDPATRLWAQIFASLSARNRTAKACAKVARGLIAGANGATDDAPVADDAALPFSGAASAGADPLADWPQTDYARTIAELESSARPERILYLFHETLFGHEALKAVGAFLDVPPVPEVSWPPVPEEDLPEMPDDIATGLRALLAPQYAAMAERFGDALPPEWQADRRLAG
jgi:ABC-type polysaccharide/polyol phosphate transport system ATPase subunit